MKHLLTFALLFAAILSTNAQCAGINLLSIQNGSFQDAIEVEFYNYQVSTTGCDSICFSMDVSTNGLLWSGSDDLETFQECNATGNPCAGDVNSPAQGDCLECWDFLHVEVSGAGVIYQNTLGDDLNDETEDTWSTGFISSVDDSISIDVRGVTSNVDEILSFSQLSLICYTETCGILSVSTSCENSPFICDQAEFTDYESCLPPYGGSPIGGLCDGFLVNNPNYLGFVAGSETISFRITPGVCENGAGMQVAITNPCSATDCYDDGMGECFDDVFDLTASGLTIGNSYQIVFDGCAGDVCTYAVQVLTGTIGASITPANVGISSVNGIESSQHDYMVGDTVSFYPEGMNGDNFTHCWDIDRTDGITAIANIPDTPLFDCSGEFISEGGLDLQFNEPGNYILCLQATSNNCEVINPSNFCYGISIDTMNNNTCSQGAISIIRSENPSESSFGPFCPGETVTVCYDLNFMVDNAGQGNNCQWLQGIIPSFGGGWDMTSFDPSSVTEQGTVWFEDDVVQYNAVGTTNISRTTNCSGEPFISTNPNLPRIGLGDLLPGGWFWTSQAALGCDNDGNPNTMWGLPAGCGSTINVNFCFDITTKNSTDPGELATPCFSNHDINFMVFSDGMTGCWSNNNCGEAVPDNFSSTQSLCNDPIVDNDGDGFDSTVDCNDDNPNINPGAMEICDDLDNNCNGLIDEGLDSQEPPMLSCALSTDSAITFTWNANPLVNLYFIYIDGSFITETTDLSYTATGLTTGQSVTLTVEAIYGNGCPNSLNTIICQAVQSTDNDGDGFNSGVDCDDNDAAVNPDAIETCDGIDNNCNGVVDEGFTVPSAPDVACSSSTPNSVVIEINPQAGVSEYMIFVTLSSGEFVTIVNDQSYLVDGLIPEDKVTFVVTPLSADGCPGASTTICCVAESVQDLDGDGFDSSVDCDDFNPLVNPSATEVCDGIDNNCDGQVDEGFTLSTYYADIDDDGFGDPNDSIEACMPITGFVDNNLDCDDNDSEINPNVTEVCDGIDNNCDGAIDEGFTLETYYADLDGDGFGDPNSIFEECEITEELSENSLDCDDTDPNINPDAEEINGNGIDEDCDGMDGSVAIKEIEKLEANMFPNPTKGLLNIETNIDLQKVWAVSMDGQKMSLSKSKVSFDVSNLTTGLYFIQAEDSEGNIYWLGKVVKE